MKVVGTAPHEFAANFLFDSHGLKPYFGADSVVKQNGGSLRSKFTDDGERWIATLYHQDSGIVHPGETNPQGTRFDIETLREFRIAVKRHPDEDPIGEQDFNAHIAPRWHGMETESKTGERSEFSVPENFQEGINVRVNGSNIEFSRYHDLLRRAFSAVNLSPRYADDPHPYSNIQDAERYLRIAADRSGRIHARDGPISSMGHLLENDRSGYRKVEQKDDDDHGNNVPGYYHTVTLGPRRIREAFPNHQLPKEIKHYYARHAASKDDEHPLSHPKLGASYQVNRWDGKLGIDELDKLNDELNQTVYSVLADAGLQLHSGESGPFVSDAYFDAAEIEVAENPAVSLDLTQVQQTQESVVIKHLADGLSPVQWESLETLVADGGEVAPTDIAEQHDRHPESVRRALRAMQDLVDREYDRVSLRSTHVSDLVHDAVQHAEDAIRRAAETGAKAIAAADRDLDAGTSALIAWAANHDLDLTQTDSGYVEIDIGEIEADSLKEARQEIRRKLRDGLHVWTDAGQKRSHYIGGEWSARVQYDKFADRHTIEQIQHQGMNGHIGAQIRR